MFFQIVHQFRLGSNGLLQSKFLSIDSFHNYVVLKGVQRNRFLSIFWMLILPLFLRSISTWSSKYLIWNDSVLIFISTPLLLTSSKIISIAPKHHDRNTADLNNFIFFVSWMKSNNFKYAEMFCLVNVYRPDFVMYCKALAVRMWEHSRPISGCTCCHHNMYNILKGWQLPNGFWSVRTTYTNLHTKIFALKHGKFKKILFREGKYAISRKNLANESLRNCDVRQVLCILTIFCRFKPKNVCILPKFSSFQLFQSEIILVKCCKEVIVPPE